MYEAFSQRNYRVRRTSWFINLVPMKLKNIKSIERVTGLTVNN